MPFEMRFLFNRHSLIGMTCERSDAIQRRRQIMSRIWMACRSLHSQ